MRRFTFAFWACLLFMGMYTSAQANDKGLSAYLSNVTERGRALYAYDQAAWHGTDAFLALHPDTNGLTHYICMKTPAGWEVVFPRWNATHDRLHVVYEAREAGSPANYKAVKYDPPREGPDDLVAKERALELALNSFPHQSRPYNAAILPVENGNQYIYLYPAQTKDTVWPLGGDVRFTISADGKQILEKRQLHKTILDMEFDPARHAVAGLHVHVLSDMPEDTDVFYVLNRRPLIPEYIGAGKRVFCVNVDGSITIDTKMKLPAAPK